MEPLADTEPPHFQTLEKNRGRLETRRVRQSADIGRFADAPQWEGLKTFALMRRTREFPDGRKEKSQHIYLSSLAPDAQLAARVIRSHWGIENPCHWSLDVSFGEDQSRARTGNAAQNLSAINKTCLNLLRAWKPHKAYAKHTSIRAKQNLAAMKPSCLRSLFILFAKTCATAGRQNAKRTEKTPPQPPKQRTAAS